MFRSECASMCDDAGRLTAVRYGTWRDAPGLVAEIVLVFEAGSWTLGVNPDDDTIRIVDGHVASSAGVSVDEAPEDSPWAGALGRSAQWIWVLRNQQGYHDGIQFAFAEDGREVCRVQMIAVASGWRICTVPV